MEAHNVKRITADQIAREMIPDFDTKIERQARIRHEQLEWYEHVVLFEYGLEYVITTLAGKLMIIRLLLVQTMAPLVWILIKVLSPYQKLMNTVI